MTNRTKLKVSNNYDSLKELLVYIDQTSEPIQ